MRLFVVSKLVQEVNIQMDTIPNKVQALKIMWANGMIGALAAFDNREDAEKYAGDKDVSILEFDLPEKEKDSVS